MPVSATLAKRLMLLAPSFPSDRDESLNEVFRHPRFLNSTPEEKRAAMLASARWREREEEAKPFFQTYFPGLDPAAYIRGKSLFDFGCFTGGRGIAWGLKYGAAEVGGSDINPVYIEAASLRAAEAGLRHEYRVLGEGGRLPFPDARFDTAVSFDVFEHVDDLPRSLAECARVLKPGGVLFAVFPTFYQPLESHLGLATRLPALQLLFPARAVREAYLSVMRERGEAASWYAPNGLSEWEKLPTLNGVTRRSFYRMLKELPFDLERETRTPILVSGKSYPALRRYAVAPALRLLLATRLFDEVLLDRVAVILRRR